MDAEEYFLDFHVLDNAPAPVLLNDSFLFDAEAYSKYKCYLLDDDDEELLTATENGFLCHITTDDDHNSQGPSRASRHPHTV